MVRDYVADPLVHHGKLPRAHGGRAGGRAIDAFPQRGATITVPTLITVRDRRRRSRRRAGSVMLGERIGAADKTVSPTTGLFHEILNEPERETVLADYARGWLRTSQRSA